MSALTSASLPYHQPQILTILVPSSLLLALNVVNFLLDKTVYCGLLGQILIGVAWGTPGARWVGVDAERVIVQLGYLGLILLVYEGGLSTSFSALKANLVLSICVALTGVSLPIALSFILRPLLGAMPLQSFTAGAALCSTSLGTTFTVLATSGLTKSRLGVVLTSAAMMDDVVGLVMVQVISNLGGDASELSAATILRPVLVSIAFAVIVPVVCRFLMKPVTVRLNTWRVSKSDGVVQRIMALRHFAFVVHTLLLLAMVAGGNYAGTSDLFTAYLAGAGISWWDTEVPHIIPGIDKKAEAAAKEMAMAPSSSADLNTNPAETSGPAIYSHYYAQPVDKLLKPLFFASVGFSIPISKMFAPAVVWRGVVYTILMFIGKVICGLWLVRLSTPNPFSGAARSALSKMRLPTWPHSWLGDARKRKEEEHQSTAKASTKQSKDNKNGDNDAPAPEPKTSPEPAAPSKAENHTSPAPTKPLSLYPAAIVGSAMVARGEIGFLISSLAESKGVFGSSSSAGSSDIFLTVTWAIMLCTILGPFAVGLLARRVRRLEGGRGEGKRDVLGVWGVE
ncbi:Sodium/hydrogen exchanger [Saccharata proteae CBS 121410]|uniref:Sodium/hydrogen exchanger n=1 Tax=Saccharata proteae CBS 121410 TaxID=1314787 RepID=A0A9P4HVR2_9PEZI|nr:Sodium/hydrogen exchanger [Saccharata proteae CBS 121410]